MATLTIPDLTYERLKDMANARKLPLEQFIEEMAIAALGISPQVAKPGTAEWMTLFDDWIGDHLKSDVVADDSRDPIYRDERN